MADELLSSRALNRALLARQLLLERATLAPEDAVRHLVGMQAQEPQAPYLGLWSRLRDFDPDALSQLLDARAVVRAGLMRVTIHLVTREDYLALWPLVRDVCARQFAGSAFARRLGQARPEEVAAAAAPLLEAAPQSRPALGQALAARWPGAQPEALAMAATLLAPVVQVPPRGRWQARGQPRWAPAPQWLGADPPEHGDARPIVRRYLAAFGPATVADIAAWSGMTGVRAMVDELAGELVVRRDEAGRELFDVRGAPLPAPDTPAPVRFLAPFDNAILAHADRARIVPPKLRPRLFEDRLMRTFLVDGFVAGSWRVDRGALIVAPFARLSREDAASVRGEARRVAGFLGVTAPRR